MNQITPELNPMTYADTITALFRVLADCNRADSHDNKQPWQRSEDASQRSGAYGHIRNALIALAGEEIVSHWAETDEVDLSLASRSDKTIPRPAIIIADAPAADEEFWTLIDTSTEDTPRANVIQLIEIDGDLYTSTRDITDEHLKECYTGDDTAILLDRGDEGEVNCIHWPNLDAEHLRRALYDAREEGMIPKNTTHATLPDGTDFPISC